MKKKVLLIAGGVLVVVGSICFNKTLTGHSYLHISRN